MTYIELLDLVMEATLGEDDSAEVVTEGANVDLRKVMRAEVKLCKEAINTAKKAYNEGDTTSMKSAFGEARVSIGRMETAYKNCDANELAGAMYSYGLTILKTLAISLIPVAGSVVGVIKAYVDAIIGAIDTWERGKKEGVSVDLLNTNKTKMFSMIKKMKELLDKVEKECNATAKDMDDAKESDGVKESVGIRLSIYEAEAAGEITKEERDFLLDVATD